LLSCIAIVITSYLTAEESEEIQEEFELVRKSVVSA